MCNRALHVTIDVCGRLIKHHGNGRALSVWHSILQTCVTACMAQRMQSYEHGSRLPSWLTGGAARRPAQTRAQQLLYAHPECIPLLCTHMIQRSIRDAHSGSASLMDYKGGVCLVSLRWQSCVACRVETHMTAGHSHQPRPNPEVLMFTGLERLPHTLCLHFCKHALCVAQR